MFSENLSIGIKLANGLGLTIVGMGVVFTALILISIALDALRVISDSLDRRRSTPADSGKPSGAAPKDPPEAEENQLVAVITAAVAAASGTTRDAFVVRSIRPRPSGDPVWSLAGRQQQMKDRLQIQNSKGYAR